MGAVVGVVEEIVLDERTDARVRRSTDERLLELRLLPREAIEVRRLDLLLVDDARARVPALAAEEVRVE